jgi:hypothetical protein
VAITFRPLPADHPLFQGGVSFIFRNELPEVEQDTSATIIVGEPISTLAYAEQLRAEQEAQQRADSDDEQQQ